MPYILETADLEGFDGQLNLTQLLVTQDLADKSSDYDVLHDKVKDRISTEHETELFDEDTASDEAPPPETPAEDAAPAPDAPEEESEDDAPTEADEVDTDEEPAAPTQSDGKQQTPVTESMRNEYYDRQIAMEALGMGTFGDSLVSGGNALGAAITVGAGIAKDVTVWVAGKTWDLTKFLGALGIQYTPVAWKALKKTVGFLFLKSAKLLLKTTFAVTDYVKRMGKNYTKFKKQIRQQRQLLEQMAILEHLTLQEGSYTKQLSWFTVGEVTDPLKSGEAIKAFVESTVEQIDRGMSGQVGVLKKLVQMSASQLPSNLTQLFQVEPFTGHYVRKMLQGYVADPDLIESFVYAEPLPDGVTLVAQLPVASLKDLDSISSAYQQSSLFLGPDPRGQQVAESIDYVDLQQVKANLDVLEQLCDLGLSHQQFYQKVLKECGELKFGYRHYYQRLLETAAETSVRDSLVEYVYLKQSFVARIYAPAAMDLHDYLTAYMVRGLRFTKANLRRFKVVKPNDPLIS